MQKWFDKIKWKKSRNKAVNVVDPCYRKGKDPKQGVKELMEPGDGLVSYSETTVRSQAPYNNVRYSAETKCVMHTYRPWGRVPLH